MKTVLLLTSFVLLLLLIIWLAFYINLADSLKGIIYHLIFLGTSSGLSFVHSAV